MNIMSWLLQVKQLRMDKQVLAAHQAATSALKASREAQGLTVELVEDTLDAFAEVTRPFSLISGRLTVEKFLVGNISLLP